MVAKEPTQLLVTGDWLRKTKNLTSHQKPVTNTQ